MKTMKNKAIAVVVLLLSVVGCLGLASCSNDDFTDPKELIKGSWRTNRSVGWATIEFNDGHWNGSYLTYEGRDAVWYYMTGTYKWDKDNYIMLDGTRDNGGAVAFRLKYVYGSYQELVLIGTPEYTEITTTFKRVGDVK